MSVHFRKLLWSLYGRQGGERNDNTVNDLVMNNIFFKIFANIYTNDKANLAKMTKKVHGIITFLLVILPDIDRF